MLPVCLKNNALAKFLQNSIKLQVDNYRKKKFILSLFSQLIYASVFLYALLLQFFRVNSKLSAQQLLLINLCMVMTARLLLLIGSFYELNHYFDPKNRNDLTKYKKSACSVECITFAIGIMIQAMAIYNVSKNRLGIVNDSSNPISTKGIVDISCILIRMFIVSPMMIYLRYRELQDSKVNNVSNDEVEKTKKLLYIQLTILVVNIIALIGKVINVLEQTNHFSLSNKVNENNNGPDNFPLGPMIRIACTLITILLIAMSYKIDVSTEFMNGCEDTAALISDEKRKTI